MWKDAFTPEMIQNWFQEAGQGHRVLTPSTNACGALAKRLSTMRFWGTPELTDVLGEIRRYGKLFVTHSNNAHVRLPETLHPAQQDLAAGILARIDQTKDQVQAFLDEFPEGHLGGWRWEHWALEIHDLALAAWATANKKPPVAKSAGQPLCKFIARAMQELKHPRTPETIRKVIETQ